MNAKVGILLGTRGLVMRAEDEGRSVHPSDVLRLAETIEANGFDSIWVGDSLTSKPRLEPLAVLSAIAAVTSRVELGTAVLLPALRHPVTLAHSLATVDLLSNGRLVIAAGAGGVFTPDQRQEWYAAGSSPESRGSRLTETIQIIKKLWSGTAVDHEGQHFQFQNLRLTPTPVRPTTVPILLACHHRTGSPAQYLRAARYADGVMGITDSPEEFSEVLAEVENLAAKEGRELDRGKHSFYLTVNINENSELAASEAKHFLTRYYQVEHWGNRWGPWGEAGIVAKRMVDYVSAGAAHLVVRFASWDQALQLQRFTEDVMPLFRTFEAEPR